MKTLLSGLGFLLAAGTLWAQQYLITTVTGGGLPPTGVIALGASFPAPQSVAVDSQGNKYFSSGTYVFEVSGAGVLTRVAGTAQRGYSGDGGPAASAQLMEPKGVALDAAGNLYIVDRLACVVRKVAVDGTITTVAGNGSADYSGDGHEATSAALNNPWGIAADAAGNLYIADSGNHRIRKVDSAGTITTVAGNGSPGFSGDGHDATLAQLQQPLGVGLGDSGTTLYIADYDNHRVRQVAPDGTITTVAGNGGIAYGGDGGKATSASLEYPIAVAVDPTGALYIADQVKAASAKWRSMAPSQPSRETEPRLTRAMAALLQAPKSGSLAAWRWTPPA